MRWGNATVLRVGTVGLPNAGKSTLFNALTGSRRQHRRRLDNEFLGHIPEVDAIAHSGEKDARDELTRLDRHP